MSGDSEEKTAGKGSRLGFIGERRANRRIRVLRQVVGWTRLLARLDGSDEAFIALAPFFKRYFAVDGFALWVREPGRWQLVFAWPPVLEEVTPRQLSWRGASSNWMSTSTPASSVTSTVRTPGWHTARV